ncbi:alpha-hydroxy-acid oxidizing protein [Amylibacter sp. SFDW26]|uniref:alpha-hydroxy acid oxidase n=1 Tax=Amylibacter sp. SFDW26 TaxID=2652722 RepID=UPI00126294E5|nr:alpha-hydroxy acid oxidase [Amylibacter sp. SFDW26]KAB7616037.1 alpha-hydroxy-acid oxidizing protein [Amylibacter sp. SFDW26]
MFFDTDIHTVSDARHLAKKRLPWMVFDYIDGAAGDGFGEQANRDAIRALRLKPRVLNNVEQRDVSVPVFGKKSDLPFGISPMGMCNLAAPKADLMLAKLAAKHFMPVGVSTAASTSLEVMMDTSEGNAWFQLYFSGNEDASNALIKRAQDAGYQTLILTVDVPEVGRRPRELRRGFKMPFKIGPRQFIDFACHPQWSLSTLFHGKPELANFGGKFGEFDRTSSRAGADWGLLAKIRDAWKGNLVVKGVLDPSDALKMKKMGVDAVQVSSHGGRQLDGSLNAINALRDIRKAVGAKYPLFYDSGLRSGEDIVKAYAVGANFTFLGRPFSYAIAAGGSRGLDQLTDILTQEVSITLAQLGETNIVSLGANHIVAA